MPFARVEVTPAEEPPVSLSEFKTHSRIDTTVEDDDVQSKLTAAIDWVQDLCGPVVESTWDQYYDAFPCRGMISLMAWQVNAILSLAYTTVDGTTFTWTAGEGGTDLVDTDGVIRAHIDVVSHPGRLVLPFSRIWPAAILRTSNPIVIRYRAGWADAAHVPNRIKSAIKLRAAALYENREDVVVDGTGRNSQLMLIDGAANLILPYRVW